MNKEKILILNGSFCEEPIIKKTKAMGYYVVTTGNMPNLQGHQYADEYIPADYSDVNAILKLVQENNIQQIISGANDFASIRNKIVPGPKVQTEGTGNYFTAHSKIMQKISAPQSVNCCVTGFRRTLPMWHWCPVSWARRRRSPRSSSS